MGVTYLWDTNIAVYYLQGQFPPEAEKLMDSLLEKGTPGISAITEIELLCWKTQNERDLEVVREFIDDVFVFELERAVKQKTADLRKAHRIKLPDAIIAATALVHELKLVTRNTRDFDLIPGLAIINPWH